MSFLVGRFVFYRRTTQEFYAELNFTSMNIFIIYKAALHATCHRFSALILPIFYYSSYNKGNFFATLKLYSVSRCLAEHSAYSDHRKRNFDCGRYKLLNEVNNDNDAKEDRNSEIEEKLLEVGKFDEVENNEIDDVVFSFKSGNKDENFCGATVINDK